MTASQASGGDDFSIDAFLAEVGRRDAAAAAAAVPQQMDGTELRRLVEVLSKLAFPHNT